LITHQNFDKHIVEAGEFEVQVGKNSTDYLSEKFGIINSNSKN
jgi:hypothetical protein